MSNNAVKEAIQLLEVLPEQEQNFALEMLRKIVIAWDSDFTKVTPKERATLEEGLKDIKENGGIPHDEIDWE